MVLNNKIRLFLVFILFFSIFLLGHLLVKEFVSFDDPYYHAKHSALIAETGNPTLVQPWLEFNFFNYAPVDPWWGFHVAQAAFIKAFGVFNGTKILVSLLAALIFAVFYFILKKYRIRSPFLWTALYFFSSSVFICRLFFERPFLLALFVLPLAFYFCAREKHVYLFFFSLFYALFYELSPLIIFMAVFYSGVEWFITKKINLKIITASSAGVLAGILIHPDSLNYLYVMLIVIFRVLFLKFSGVDLNVGSEIQTHGFLSFFSNNFLAIVFYLLAAVIFLGLEMAKKGKKAVVNYFLFFYSFLWFSLTLFLPRAVEYWLPAAFIFIAFVFNDFIESEEFKQTRQWLADKINFKIIGFFLFSALTIIIFNNLTNIYFDLPYNKTEELGKNYQQANLWLKANTEKSSVVFYNNWDMWPMMFYYNDYNHYIAGIDPTLLYEYDERTYWLWRNISSNGLYCDQAEPCLNLTPAEQIKFAPLAIKTVFRSKYAVMANHKNSALIRTLNNLRAEAKLVFKNKDLLIYEMK